MLSVLCAEEKRFQPLLPNTSSESCTGTAAHHTLAGHTLSEVSPSPSITWKNQKKKCENVRSLWLPFCPPNPRSENLAPHACTATDKREKQKKKKKKSFNRRGHAAERASDGQAEQLAYSEREEKNPGKRWKRKGGEGRWWCSASLRFCCDARGRAA